MSRRSDVARAYRSIDAMLNELSNLKNNIDRRDIASIRSYWQDRGADSFVKHHETTQRELDQLIGHMKNVLSSLKRLENSVIDADEDKRRKLEEQNRKIQSLK